MVAFFVMQFHKEPVPTLVSAGTLEVPTKYTPYVFGDLHYLHFAACDHLVATLGHVCCVV